VNFVFPPWARVALMLALFFAGYWTRGSIEARQELREAKQEIKAGNKVDEAVAEKLETEAKGDAQRAALNHKDDERARHDPSYREYREQPLPDAALEFLRNAEGVDYGPDGRNAGPHRR
jgi:hypothetical protein